MGLFDFFKRQEPKVEVPVNDVLLRALLSDETLTRKQALEIPCVASSVDLVAGTFACIPFKLYKRTESEDGKKHSVEVVDDERVRLINMDTNDTLDGYQFKKAMCEDYLLGRGGYAYIKKVRNKVKGLYYVEEKHLTFASTPDTIFKNYDIMVSGQTYGDYEFLKLLRNTKNGASGTGLVAEITRALKTGFKRLKYEYDLTVTGGSRKGFLKSVRRLDRKGIDELKKAWEEYYSGNANTVILNDGISFQEASNNSQQNELNAKTVTFNDEIRQIFHISDDYNEFIKNSIVPIATAFATALNRSLLLEKEKGEYYFQYDLTEVLKGTLKERYEAYSIAIKSGFKTRNEIRCLENDNTIDGLDVINISLGDVLLNVKDGTIYTPNTNQFVNLEKGGTEDVQV